MEKSTRARAREERGPAALAIVVVLALLTLLPERLRAWPIWVPYVAGFAVMLPMVAVTLTGASHRWLRIERAVIFTFGVAAGAGMMTNLLGVIREMVHRSGQVSGLQLLSSSIGLWASNVLIFSMLYWQVDGGGPEARRGRSGPRPDWLFPQTGVPEQAPPEWRPGFADYFCLGFNTATAFSPTDVAPLTVRAKLLMVLESSISLVVVVIVASRAINILGS